MVQRDGVEADSIISNTRNNISYKIRVRLYAWEKRDGRRGSAGAASG
jgi:hypothetical protein